MNVATAADWRPGKPNGCRACFVFFVWHLIPWERHSCRKGRRIQNGKSAAQLSHKEAQAVTAFEKWFHEWWGSKFRKQIPNHLLVLEGWLACAAEAERLCFEQEKECKHDNPCHAADADAISALREVDR